MTANASTKFMFTPFDVLVPSRKITLCIPLYSYYRFLLLSNKVSPFNHYAELAHLFICI